MLGVSADCPRGKCGQLLFLRKAWPQLSGRFRSSAGIWLQNTEIQSGPVPLWFLYPSLPPFTKCKWCIQIEHALSFCPGCTTLNHSSMGTFPYPAIIPVHGATSPGSSWFWDLHWPQGPTQSKLCCKSEGPVFGFWLCYRESLLCQIGVGQGRQILEVSLYFRMYL